MYSRLELAYPAADDLSSRFRLPGHAWPAGPCLTSGRRAALGRPARAMLGMLLCALLCAGAADAQTLGLGRPATAADIEALGETIRARVLAHSGVNLEWEIRRIGRSAAALDGGVLR